MTYLVNNYIRSSNISNSKTYKLYRYLYTYTSSRAGLDLSCLMNAMCPHKSVEEDDVVWDYNVLFQEVSSFITQHSTMGNNVPNFTPSDSDKS